MRQQPSFISAQNTDSKFIYLVFIVVAFGGLSSSVTRWLSKVPSWLTTFAPADALTMKEEAWNAFPECKSGYQSKICCSGDFLLTASADKQSSFLAYYFCTSRCSHHERGSLGMHSQNAKQVASLKFVARGDFLLTASADKRKSLGIGLSSDGI
ncbi:uncharacterized protein LOC121239847 isoform X2 [Juglans microcarpa x Juglans regia]|uniref:uncharacterized protein LOC121239847 isoform X2 n=1 Tax=Juglans microcarpa x Juglans regia TaxID=2249226 RepID=UPI001B7F1817|nr:uncharacterized protein LOC121239847 isoform X2 [Juglans microcarpa x Juglans regia]